VGKTSLARRFANDVFEPDYESTLSMAIFRGALLFDDLSLELRLWDPGGGEAWNQYNRSFISGASGLVFVVDATNPDTLVHLLEAQHRGRGFIGSRPSLLIVNKVDLTADFALTKEQLDEAGRLDWYIAQASAVSGYNVKESFERLGKMMLDAKKASA
jgi:GTPase SAR1 family protein